MANQRRSTLNNSAAQIRNETGRRKNTALRIGQALTDLSDSVSLSSDRTPFTYAPDYDLFSGALAVQHYYQIGTLTIPASKQYDILRFEGSVNGGARFSPFNFDLTVTNTTNAYGVIGIIKNTGSGVTKAIYGRAQAQTGCTGVVVGVVAGCTVDSGVVATDMYGVQISMDGTGTPTVSAAVRIDTAEANRTIQNGILSMDIIRYSDAFIKGFNLGTGSFLKWQSATQVPFEVDKDGAIYKRDATSGLTLFNVAANGETSWGSTSAPQIVLHLYNGTRGYQIQAVTTGDYLRILADGIGDLVKFKATGDVTLAGTIDYGISNALGGGAAPTFGTIGGSGPTTAAQSKWLPVKIAGAMHWIPVWV